jgi:hypothetical protein
MESMRRSTLLLLAVCLGLAVVLAYAARELHAERARSRAQVAELTELRARIPAAGQPRLAPEPLAVATPPEEPPALPADTAVPEPEAEGAPRVDDLAKSEAEARALRRMPSDQAAWLKRLADPASRAVLRAETIAEMRQTSPDLARAIGLTPQQETKLIELLADQELQMRELGARGHHATATRPVDHHQLKERQEEELRALLGSEKVERFRQYRASAPERAQVQALRARLDGANALREDQATRLVALMRQEREAYVASFTDIGAGGFMANYPFTPFSSGDEPAEEIQFAEAQLGRTEEFLQRLQGQAATVLTREQLRRYAEIQEEQMNSERNRLEWLRARASGSKR